MLAVIGGSGAQAGAAAFASQPSLVSDLGLTRPVSDLGKLVVEAGYNCCSSVALARELLDNFDARDLSPEAIARCLGVLRRRAAPGTDFPSRTLGKISRHSGSDSPPLAPSGHMARTNDGLEENLPLQSLSSQAAWDKAKDAQPQGSTWNVENLIDALSAKVAPAPAPRRAASPPDALR